MKVITTLLLLAAALVLFSTQGFAQANHDAHFAQAFAMFQKGEQGDADANDNALSMFEKLHGAEPDNPLFQVYFGATYTLRGKYGWFPFSRLQNTEKGLTLIENALNKLTSAHDTQHTLGGSVSVITRGVAANTYLRVPGFFNRFEDAKAVLANLLHDPALTQGPPETQAWIFSLAGDAYLQDGKTAEGEKYLEQAIQTAPESIGAKRAKAQLDHRRKNTSANVHQHPIAQTPKRVEEQL